MFNLTAVPPESCGHSRRKALRAGWLPVVTAVACCFSAAAAVAEEPADRFLQELRRVGYFDTALTFLEMAENDPLVPIEFRILIPYERGATLVEAANRERDREARERQLDQAQASLDAFMSGQPEHPLVPAARRQLGNLTVQRGRMLVDAAERGPGPRDTAQLAQAANLYDRAYDIFIQTRAELKATLEAMKDQYDPRSESDEYELQQRLRSEYLEAQLLVGWVLEEKAETATDEAGRNELLTRAAEEYFAIYEKYRRRVAGLYAHLYQGRCLQKMGQFDEAAAIYVNDLLNQPDQPEPFREVKVETMKLAMECWLHPDNGKYLEAATRGLEFLALMRPGEGSQPNWIQLRLDVARAHMLYADEVAARDPNDRQINDLRNEARRLARMVARFPGEFQQPANELLASLPGGVASTADDANAPPETYDEAFTRAREAFAQMQTAQYALETLPSELASAADDDQRATVQASLDEANQAFQASRDRALAMFRLAMGMADSETPVEDLNEIRFHLAYLHFLRDEVYDAAVLGEFLSRRYPGSPRARNSAEIALAAYRVLYAQADADSRTFEVQRLRDFAEYMSQTWTGEAEAVEALNALIPLAIAEGDLEKARGYLDQIPVSSPMRAAAELRNGQALWAAYVEAMQDAQRWELEARENELAPGEISAELARRRSEAQPLRDGAEELLTSGIDRLRQEPDADARLLDGALLSLALILVDTERPTEALEILGDGESGLLARLAFGTPGADQQRLAEAGYKAGLRACIGALAEASGDQASQELMRQARTYMEGLKEAVAADGDARRTLLRTYVNLARDLEQQFALIQDPEDRRVMATGFSTFLDALRQEADDFSLLYWVGSSFENLGTGSGGGSNGSARDYFQRAADVYRDILARADEDPEFMNPANRTAVRLRLALALRSAQQFREALSEFQSMLDANEVQLTLQVEAARTWQMWGDAEGSATRLDKAIKGGNLQGGDDEAPAIWGWMKISRLTSRNPEYRGAFHEARYNVAWCQVRIAELQEGSRESFLTSARNNILSTQRFDRSLGGPDQLARYDALLRQIQGKLGEPVEGLPRNNRPRP